MDTYFYVVDSIDGDYANLKRTDGDSDDLKLVARALLPDNISEGSRLKYEFLQYELIEYNSANFCAGHQALHLLWKKESCPWLPLHIVLAS